MHSEQPVVLVPVQEKQTKNLKRLIEMVDSLMRGRAGPHSFQGNDGGPHDLWVFSLEFVDLSAWLQQRGNQKE